MSPCVERVRSALEACGCKVKKTTDGYVSTCPTHDDRNPSLSLSEADDGSALLHCHASHGCTCEGIVARIGLRMADLYPDEPKSERRLVATYDYTDEAGALLYQVVRYDPKDFRQRRPDGAGGWVWNMANVRRVLYRLPLVLEAVRQNETVYVCEGERDCDAINGLDGSGFVATCNPGGAGKWNADYNATLTGARVRVVADRDEPGRRHAADVAYHLKPLAASVDVVEARTGKDAADHLAAGHTLEELLPFNTTATTPPALTPATFENVANPEVLKVPWLIEGLISSAGLTLVAAHYKTGKTFLMYRLILDALFRTTALGTFRVPRPLRVQLWQFEMPADINLRRFHKLAWGMDLDPALIYQAQQEGRFQAFVQPDISLDDAGGLGDFHEAVGAFDPDLLVVDSASEAFTGTDFNKAPEVRRALRLAFGPTTRAGRGTFVAHHKRKAPSSGKDDDGKGAILGSQAFGAAARTVYTLDRMTDNQPEAKGRFVVNLAPHGGWDIESSATTFVVADDPTGTRTTVEPVKAGRGKVKNVPLTERAALAFAEMTRKRFKVGRLAAIADVQKLVPCGQTTATDGLALAIEKRWVKALKVDGTTTNEKTLVAGEHTDWEDLV
jgi:hypothetical protein